MAGDGDDELNSSLRSHSAFFASMIKLIPERYYHVPDETEEEEDDRWGKFFRNKRNRAPKQAIKETHKRAKRMKFDVPPVETCNESEGKGEQSISTRSQDLTECDQGAASSSQFSVERVNSSSLSELRERLRSKILEFQSKRNMQAKKATEAGLKKDDGKHRQKKTKKCPADAIVSQSTSKEADRPSIKDNGHLVFSKFDFSTPIADRKRKKDYKKLLAKAEARQKKIDEMTELDLRKGQELQEHLKWQQATNRAEGKKMKDDVTLLNRTLKRLGKRKTKSRKDWEQRKSAQERQIAKHQEIRQQHIQERIEQKKAKSIGKRRGGKTRKRARKPGF